MINLQKDISIFSWWVISFSMFICVFIFNPLLAIFLGIMMLPIFINDILIKIFKGNKNDNN